MISLLSLDGGGDTPDQKKKKALPPHITTPRKGPLLLQKLQQITKSSQNVTSTELPNYLKDKGHRFKYQQQPGGGAKLVKSAGVRGCGPPQRRGFLTRYPVAVAPRPMDAIEDHLQESEMTWSQLKYNVQLMMEDGRGITAEREGYDSAESAFLHHRMKYSSHGNNDPLLAIERYTHSISSANDPNSAGHETINVSITCSRIPQTRGIAASRQASDWSTQKSSLTTSSGQIWRGASKNANPQISREKNFHKTSSTVSAHPPLRPGSRVSEKGGHSGYGVVTTDNHKRSTSLPLPLPHQTPLVQPTGLKKATTTTTTTHHNHITEPSQIRQNLMSQASSSANAYKQQGSDTISSAAAVAPRSATKEEEEEGGDIMRPSKSLRVYLASHVGPSIAPAGVRAVATHRLRPVTSNTIVKGRGLVTGAR